MKPLAAPKIKKRNTAFAAPAASPNFFNVLIAFCAGIFIVRSFKNFFDEQPERRHLAVEH